MTTRYIVSMSSCVHVAFFLRVMLAPSRLSPALVIAGAAALSASAGLTRWVTAGRYADRRVTPCSGRAHGLACIPQAAARLGRSERAADHTRLAARRWHAGLSR